MKCFTVSAAIGSVPTVSKHIDIERQNGRPYIRVGGTRCGDAATLIPVGMELADAPLTDAGLYGGANGWLVIKSEGHEGMPDDWALVLTALDAGQDHKMECRAGQQIAAAPCPNASKMMPYNMTTCPLCGTATTYVNEGKGAEWTEHPHGGIALSAEPTDVRVLAHAADGNVLLAMPPQTCADAYIVAQDDMLADSFYILHPGDALEFGRHEDPNGGDDDDNFLAYFDDGDDI